MKELSKFCELFLRSINEINANLCFVFSVWKTFFLFFVTTERKNIVSNDFAFQYFFTKYQQDRLWRRSTKIPSTESVWHFTLEWRLTLTYQNNHINKQWCNRKLKRGSTIFCYLLYTILWWIMWIFFVNKINFKNI